MPCGCGDNSGNVPLLSGSLDPRYGSQVAPPPAPADVMPGNKVLLASGGFWIVVVILIAVAWYADSNKKKGE